MFLIDLGVQAALYACKYFLKRVGLFLWTEFCRYHNKKVFCRIRIKIRPQIDRHCDSDRFSSRHPV